VGEEDAGDQLAAGVDPGLLEERVLQLNEEGAAHVVPPDGQQVHGRAALRAALAPVFALRPAAHIEVVAKLEADGLALTHARWTLAGTDGGRHLGMSGRGTIVSRRQPDGSWCVVLDNPMSFGV
jgi:ketosteroid isomerase-like protein